MSDQSLRDALEKKLATTDGCAVSNDALLAMLAEHPAESVPRPVIDREALAQRLLYEEGSEWAEGTNRHYELADAVTELARPMPTREQIDSLLRKHKVGAFQPDHTACSCDRKWRTHAEYRDHLRDAVLALLNGTEKS